MVLPLPKVFWVLQDKTNHDCVIKSGSTDRSRQQPLFITCTEIQVLQKIVIGWDQPSIMAPQVKVHIIHEQELSHADPENRTGNDSLLLWICSNLQLCDLPCTNIGPICQARASFSACSFIVQIVCCTKCAVQYSGVTVSPMTWMWCHFPH